MFLYADDTKTIRKVQSTKDCNKLQEDLNGLKEWTEKWQFSFHPEKSKHMSLDRTLADDSGYNMHTSIERTRKEKDIVVVIDDKLTFSDHLADENKQGQQDSGADKKNICALGSSRV